MNSNITMQRIARRIINELKTRLDKINNSLFLDIGKPDDLVIVAGMGRSGTTWASDIINYDKSCRILFEPFFPIEVKSSASFGYLPYICPEFQCDQLGHQASLILAGKIRNHWIDQARYRFIYYRRIVKVIRCNFMLGWLREIAHNPPIVLVIRHPLQVVSSWLKVGHEMRLFNNRSDFEHLMSKNALLDDYPIIRDVFQQIRPQNAFETYLFQWCIFYLVPSYQLKKGEAYILFYERLLCHWDEEVAALFQYLKRPIDRVQLQKIRNQPSITNFLQRDFCQDRIQVLNSWKDELSLEQIERAHSILIAFGLDHLYDSEGYPTGAQYLDDAPRTLPVKYPKRLPIDT